MFKHEHSICFPSTLSTSPVQQIFTPFFFSLLHPYLLQNFCTRWLDNDDPSFCPFRTGHQGGFQLLHIAAVALLCLCDVIWLLRLALSPPVLIENEFECQWRKLGMDNSGDKFFFLQKRGVTGTAASQLLWVSGKERHLGTPCPPWDRRYLSCVRLSCCTHTAAGSALRTRSSARLSFGTPLASGKVLFYL